MSCDEWREEKIGSICKKIGSGGTPSRNNKSFYQNGEIYWLKTMELNDWIVYKTEEKITQKALEMSSAKIFPKNTIAMAMYGATVGKLGILGTSMATNQACCNMVIDEEKADHKFIFYKLLLERKNLTNLANGAAQQNLNKKIIENYVISLPPLSEQKAIAKVLSDLDEKIEINNRINKVLEEIAQAIFKHWFIDFEFPVVLTYPDYIPEETRKELMKYGYKSFGSLPAPEPGKFFVYALEYEDSTIYIGQTDFLLQSWHEHVNGKGSEYTRNHKPVRFVYWEKVNSQNEALEREKWLKSDPGKKWLEREISNNPMNQGGEMQPSPLGPIPKGWEVKPFSEIIKIRSGKRPKKKQKTKTDKFNIPLIGASSIMGYVDEPLYNSKILVIGRVGTHGVVQRFDGPTYPSDNTLVIQSDYYEYVYQILKRIDYYSLNIGSTQPLITQTTMKSLDTIIPHYDICLKFEFLVSKLMSMIGINQKENNFLSTLRDTLLPMLMSGEIRVPMDDFDL